MNAESLNPETADLNKKDLRQSFFLCALSQGPHSVNVYSSQAKFLPFTEDNTAKYAPWIPGWRVDSSPQSTDYSILYCPSQESGLRYFKKQKTLLMHGQEEEFSDGQAIAYGSLWLNEVQRQKEGMVLTHGAALSNDDGGVLILGERGAGKTSVCLELGRKYGYKLIGNDLTILGFNQTFDQITICDGTKIFGLRLQAVRSNFPDLLYLLPEQDRRSWNVRAFVSPESLGVETEKEPRSLKRVFMVHLDNSGVDKLSFYKMDELTIKNFLYENFSRYIRGSALLLFGQRSKGPLGYLPSLDSEELSNFRWSLINCLINKLEIINVSGGNLQEIAAFIDTAMLISSKG